MLSNKNKMIKLKKAINVIYTKLPQGDVNMKESEKYLNDSSVNL